MLKGKNRGRGWHGDPEGHAMAGKKGGETTYEEYGEKFYSEIGSKGGQVSGGNFRNDRERARKAGRKDGSR